MPSRQPPPQRDNRARYRSTAAALPRIARSTYWVQGSPLVTTVVIRLCHNIRMNGSPAQTAPIALPLPIRAVSRRPTFFFCTASARRIAFSPKGSPHFEPADKAGMSTKLQVMFFYRPNFGFVLSGTMRHLVRTHFAARAVSTIAIRTAACIIDSAIVGRLR
jgi:hypothetical protein